MKNSLAQARAKWPAFEVPHAIFERYVIARAPSPEDFMALRLDDLYLACGCAEGDPQALAAFRDTLGPALRHAVSKAVPSGLVDEAQQRVLTKLFVAERPRRPAIASYNGRGKLATWVQVVARREASNTRRAERRREDLHEQELLLRRAMCVVEDELAVGLKQAYRGAFKEAFAVALTKLSPRERNLLRYEVIDQLTIDKIARIYGVSASTVARWRARSRTRLFRLTRRCFRQAAEVSSADFPSAMRMIESRFDVSLARLLGHSIEPTHVEPTHVEQTQASHDSSATIAASKPWFESATP